MPFWLSYKIAYTFSLCSKAKLASTKASGKSRTATDSQAHNRIRSFPRCLVEIPIIGNGGTVPPFSLAKVWRLPTSKTTIRSAAPEKTSY